MNKNDKYTGNPEDYPFTDAFNKKKMKELYERCRRRELQKRKLKLQHVHYGRCYLNENNKVVAFCQD